MGKPRKNRVRAQRKFAQGAYVPPQNTPVSAPTQVTVNAGHRARSAPGPVTKNVCSATDLLTRMSFGKTHNHSRKWPIVVLEDCVKRFNSTIETHNHSTKWPIVVLEDCVKRFNSTIETHNHSTKWPIVVLEDCVKRFNSTIETHNHSTKWPIVVLEDCVKRFNSTIETHNHSTKCPIIVLEDCVKRFNSTIETHSHSTKRPIVLLEDCAKSFNIETDKKKLTKKRLSRRLLLRNARKHVSDVSDRDSSESDSAEDTPLSHLQNPQVILSKLVKNVPVGNTEGTTSRTTKTDIEKHVDHVNPSSAKIRPNRTTNGKTQQIESKNKLDLKKKVVDRQGLAQRNILKPSPKTRSLQRHANPESSSTEWYGMRNIKRNGLKRTQKKSCLKSFQTQVKSRRKTCTVSSEKKIEEKLIAQLEQEQPLFRVVKTTKSLIHIEKKVNTEEIIQKFKINNKELVNDDSDLKDNNRALEDIHDENALIHIEKKVNTEEIIQKFKINNKELVNDDSDLKDNNRALEDIHDENDDFQIANLVISNIKTLNEDIEMFEATDSTDTIDKNVKYPSKDLEMPIQPEPVNDWNLEMSNFHFNACDMDAIQPETDNTDHNVNYPSNDPDMPMPPVEETIIGNVNYASNDRDMAPSTLESDIIDLTSSESLTDSKPDINDPISCDTAEVTKVNSPCNDIEMTPIQPESNVNNLSSSECQLQNIADVHELLSSEVSCNTCRRCTLITKYKQILKMVPKRREAEPNFEDIAQLPSCPFESDDEYSFFFLDDCKKREKICNLIKSNKLILWLINPQIDLDNKYGFEMEHMTGTLKRRLKLDSENDVMVDILLNRVDYLNCSIVDNEDMNLERPLRKTIIPEWSEAPVINLESDDEIEEEPLVYRPTLDEFKDPITYISSIQKKASKNGICKIIPPDGFHVPCHLDEDCMFGTTNQHLGRLYYRWGPNTREFATIQTSMTSLTPEHKERFTKAPLFGGIEVDLVKLYNHILEEGGIQGHLSRDEKWARIAAKMNLVFPDSKLDWKKLENIYCKHVLPYESLTFAEREAAGKKVDKIWETRLKNLILRARQPLHYQHAMLSESNVPEYEERDFPDPELADLYNLCKPIFDKIEECTCKGRSMNLATFRRISKKIEAMRFPNGVPSDVEEIEKHFWKILNRRDEHVCVQSAFIDTSVNNLGHESDPKKRGGSHPWNLKRIGENPNNILHSLGKALSVTVPTLCLNQMFSTSCWHKDPHKLAWMDYMHEGATKIWYSVPDEGAPAFRCAVQMMTEAAVQDKGIWLASDTTMIPPGYLMACGVPFKRIEQNPNEFIVVFPGAYACSISTGLSVAESIYFENNTWLDRVEKIFEDLHKDCEPAMFSSIRLIMKIARNPRLTPEVSKTVASLLKKCIKAEFQARRLAQWQNCKVTTDKRGREEGDLLPVSWPNQEECCLCRMPLVLSKMSKYDQPRKQMCIAHGTQYMRILNQRSEEDRPEEPPLLTLHYTNQELIEMMGTMEVYNMSTD